MHLCDIYTQCAENFFGFVIAKSSMKEKMKVENLSQPAYILEKKIKVRQWIGESYTFNKNKLEIITIVKQQASDQKIC